MTKIDNDPDKPTAKICRLGNRFWQKEKNSCWKMQGFAH
jgi:hypothetical protein